ncbi:uncharacterized protein LOC136088268 [Hydra vulgaris]|uniref:Uncharacterized protein LOC136088268 n=1 Tax=Hydra vulgaris TaxID=6087 RepID=A0ABM4D191_HYDVU
MYLVFAVFNDNLLNLSLSFSSSTFAVTKCSVIDVDVENKLVSSTNIMTFSILEMSKNKKRSYSDEYMKYAQKKKAHTLTEEVILPCSKEIVRLLFGEEAVTKIDNISLSNTAVKRRLTNISSNIKENVINEIKKSPYFSIQLDKSTDTGFGNQNITGNLKTVFNPLVKLVNHIKSSALNTRLFTKFCSDLDAEHNKLLFYTSVQWLSAGNFLERFFKLRNEVKEFLCQMKSGLVEYFEFDNFEITTAYLVEIVGHFNKLNLQLQGKNANVITHSDKLKALKSSNCIRLELIMEI